MNQPNWQKMITFLLLYNTQTELSAKTGLDQSSISRIKKHGGHKHMTYNSGVALIAEYNKTLKEREVATHEQY